MSGKSSPASDRAHGLLHSLLRTLTGIEQAETAAYVVLSLAAAFAGSLAAMLLVPLVQPGHTLPFGGVLFNAGHSVEVQAVIFAAAMASLPWCVGRRRLGASGGSLWHEPASPGSCADVAR